MIRFHAIKMGENTMGIFSRSLKIKVVYHNGTSERIPPSLLPKLIDAKEIAQFQRSDGWVTIGIDTIRGMGGPPYLGDNRRSSDT